MTKLTNRCADLDGLISKTHAERAEGDYEHGFYNGLVTARNIIDGAPLDEGLVKPPRIWRRLS